MKRLFVLAVLLAATLGFARSASAHCEVPCGIYDDQMRIAMIREDIATIEKAMKQIVELGASSDAPLNYNQIVRWINAKEDHATRLQHTVEQYFMTQRIKPAHGADGSPSKRYVDQLTLLHMMLVHAMKAKQTTDLGQVDTLRKLVDQFSQIYFEDR